MFLTDPYLVDIGTEWNLELLRRLVSRNRDYVDIGTEWNLEMPFSPGGTGAGSGRYRNRVEFRGQHWTTVQEMVEVDIGTEWNLELTPFIKSSNPYRVDIGTEWNLELF